MTEDRFAHLYNKWVLQTQSSAIRDMCALVQDPEIKSLAGGWPDPSVFPGAEISQITAELLAEKPHLVLQYGVTEGVPALRQLMAERARKLYGINCSADEIFIAQGSQQAMDLATRLFVAPGDVVMVGLPTYVGGTGAISVQTGEAVGIPVDEEGINTDLMAKELERITQVGKRVKAVYVIPNFQNPTGVTMTLRRRQSLVELAQKHDFIIFEDDAYSDLRYEGQTPPSLRALDETGRVIHMRSLSKIFCPGMRLAWVVADAAVISRMATAKQFVDTCTNSLAQYVLLEYIQRGLLDKKLQVILSYYCRKRDFMLSQLERHFPREVRWNRPEGGFFIWVHLPEHLDGSVVLREAIDQKVVFVPGSAFYIDGGGRNTIRLSFAQVDEATIEVAIAELGRIIKRKLNQ